MIKNSINEISVLIIDPNISADDPGEFLEGGLEEVNIRSSYCSSLEEGLLAAEESRFDAAVVSSELLSNEDNPVQRLRNYFGETPVIIIKEEFDNQPVDYLDTEVIPRKYLNSFTLYKAARNSFDRKGLQDIVKKRIYSAQEGNVIDYIKEIKLKNELLDKILEYIPVGIWIADEEGTIVRSNRIGEEIWKGAKYVPINELHEYKGWWHETGNRLDNEEWGVYRAIKNGEISSNEVIDIECFDKSRKTILNSAVPIYDDKNRLIGAVVVNQDITGLKLIEAELKESVREKEVLLKELHHRVKNNLQIISSIFNLQRNYTQNKSIDEILTSSQNRIKSMALLHEKLYKSDDLERIEFAEYVKELLSIIRSTYIQPQKKITIITEVDEFFVKVDTGINIGLIINELVSNSLKHAFKDKIEGEIKVKISKQPSEEVINLIIADNGSGIPGEVYERENSSLGLLIVNALVDQVGGTLNNIRGTGTIYEITIPAS